MIHLLALKEQQFDQIASMFASCSRTLRKKEDEVDALNKGLKRGPWSAKKDLKKVRIEDLGVATRVSAVLHP